MDEAFARAAFALKKDEIGPPIVTVFGVHLIKLLDVKPGTKQWTDVRDALRSAFAEQLFHRRVAAVGRHVQSGVHRQEPLFQAGDDRVGDAEVSRPWMEQGANSDDEGRKSRRRIRLSIQAVRQRIAPLPLEAVACGGASASAEPVGRVEDRPDGRAAAELG